MSYILVIVYSCGEVKGIAKKIVCVLPKWEVERWESGASAAWR
jgi:hypothetical protein